MKPLYFLLFVMVLMISIGSTFFVLSHKKSVPTPLPQTSVATPTPTLISTPAPVGNFSEQGKYLEVYGRPVFQYELPGQSAISLDLRFAGESICDLGQGEGKCNVHLLTSGDQVAIEGNKIENELTIIKMRKLL